MNAFYLPFKKNRIAEDDDNDDDDDGDESDEFSENENSEEVVEDEIKDFGLKSLLEEDEEKKSQVNFSSFIQNVLQHNKKPTCA